MISQEEFTQSDPLLIVLYGITLVTLTDELHAADPKLLPPFYSYNALFDDLVRRSSRLMSILL